MNGERQLKKINNVARFALCFILIYHGLVPKILYLDETEKLLVELHSFSISTHLISLTAGLFEILLGISIVVMKRNTLILYFIIVLFLLLLIDVSIIQPQLLVNAFNPLTINVSAIALCYIALLTLLENTIHQELKKSSYQGVACN